MPEFYVNVVRDEVWKVTAKTRQDAEILYDEEGRLIGEEVVTKTYSSLEDWKRDAG
jgi:hypothetical protein